jgi:NAD(P)-dependent dehydrogenase (short-subunit alcohol dehydrogenase family)
MKFSNSVVLVTGANRGYGEAIAREFLDRLDEESMLLLHSRTGTVPWLQKEVIDSSKCKIGTLKGDLSDNINWNELLLSGVGHMSFQNAFLISNAGTCGNIEKPLLETHLESGHMLGMILNIYFG